MRLRRPAFFAHHTLERRLDQHARAIGDVAEMPV